MSMLLQVEDDRGKSKDIARSKSGALVTKEVQGTGVAAVLPGVGAT